MVIVGLSESIYSLPLVGKILQEPPQQMRIVVDTPTQLSSRLKERELDLSLIPLSDYLDGKRHYQLIKEFGIATDGFTHSIHLYSRLPLSYIQKIYFLKQLKTSAHLCHLLCNLHWHIQPQFQSVDRFETLIEQDGFLLIDEMALLRPYIEGYHTTDLCQQWNEMTSLPFVFEVIAAQSDCEPAKIDTFLQALHRSYDWGEQNKKEILYMARRQLPIREDFIYNYYHHLSYFLTAKEIQAIHLFEEQLTQTQLQL